MDYTKEIHDLIIVTSAAMGKPLTDKDFYIVHQPIHHSSLKLPKGKMAVYTFVYQNKFLKIGQANVKSPARYQSHHYHIKSGDSTLANSLLADPKMQPLVTQQNITQWIKDNCERFDVIINGNLGKLTLNFIEGILHYKYNPIYEG